MARRKTKSTKAPKKTSKPVYCGVKPEITPDIPVDVDPDRRSLIIRSRKKWANGTVLRFYFFKSPSSWRGSNSDIKKVRDAFKAWKNLGIGLEFKEVGDPNEAEIRIGFLGGDGHWSYIGKDVLAQGADRRTMNIDKHDAWPVDTAIHEIGHTLGYPHEHQNPMAGIEWDEKKVYDYFSKAPNNWDEQTTYHNILRKIDPDVIQGSTWDRDSVMHYSFEAGLILKPSKYQKAPLEPAPGLSARDEKWVKEFYPALKDSDYKQLEPFKSVPIRLEPGEQANFTVSPAATRLYNFKSFGDSDSVLVLFEEVDGELRFRAGDDDSGHDRNATLSEKLFADRNYVLRLRLHWQHTAGDVAVMMW